MIRYAFPLIAGLALAACDKETPAAPAGGDDTRRAEGTIEGGAISDAMIPLDTLTSAAPPLKESGAGSAAGRGGAKATRDTPDPAPTGNDAPAQPVSEAAATDDASED